MRYVSKDLNDIPDCLNNEKAIESLRKIAEGNPDLIDDDIYKGAYKDEKNTKKSKVRDHLNKYYFNKCAYCEELTKAEIEHYRPKKGVTGLRKEQHQGYFWLCYEWSNLVPACRYCNTEGGKGNDFPVAKTYITKPVLIDMQLDLKSNIANCPPLINEEPLLLHPEIDDPKKYLGFKISKKDTIDLAGIGDEIRGEETIRICNLNRENLSLARYQRVIWNMRQALVNVFKNLEKGLLPEDKLYDALAICFDEFTESLNDVKLEFTLLRWYVIADDSNFDKLILPFIGKEQQAIVSAAFKSYIKS